MDACERILYVNVAKVVKWADFDSKSPPMSTTASGKLVRNWIQEFETALGVSPGINRKFLQKLCSLSISGMLSLVPC